MPKSKPVNAKECSFVVKAYQRTDTKCKIQIFNGNGHDIRITVKKIAKKAALAAAILFFAAAPAYASVNHFDAVRAIVGEASNQSFVGMVAVGEVIQARDYYSERYKHGGLYGMNAVHVKHESARTWMKAWFAWFVSHFTDYTHGATMFENIYAFGFPKSWDREKVVCVAVYGDQWFFKELALRS